MDLQIDPVLAYRAPPEGPQEASLGPFWASKRGSRRKEAKMQKSLFYLGKTTIFEVQRGSIQALRWP